MLEGSYIMDSMVFQAYFNIYYGIIVGTTWYRGGLLPMILFLSSVFLIPMSLLHIDISQYNK